MSKKTRLMSKLFSDSTPDEYKEMVAEAAESAKEDGNSKVVDEESGEELLLSAVEDGVIIEDKYNDGVEKTLVTSNPDDENDLVLTAVEEQTPDGATVEGTVSEETKTESEDQNLKSVEISVLPGKGDEPEADLVDDLNIVVNEEVEGTQRYSMRFKNFSEKKAKMIAKLFSESCKAIESLCNCDVDEDVQVKFEGDKMKIFSVTIGKAAKTFSETTEETKDPEEPTTEPTTEPETKTEPEPEPKTEPETKTESETEDKIKLCPETHMFYIEGKEEKYPTYEEAKKVLEGTKEETKTESEPSVTVTIENLEPASVADLLGVKEEKEDDKKNELEPKVNPNEHSFGDGPKAFSLVDRMGKEESCNPYLTTEIY